VPVSERPALVSPEEAARLVGERGFALLDVRSEPEFAEARARSAVNVPWKRAAPSGLVQNTYFIDEVRARFVPEAGLVVYCRADGRSRPAAAALVAAGFADVVVLESGFDGLRDHFGRVVRPGWLAAGLPVERDA